MPRICSVYQSRAAFSSSPPSFIFLISSLRTIHPRMGGTLKITFTIEVEENHPPTCPSADRHTGGIELHVLSCFPHFLIRSRKLLYRPIRPVSPTIYAAPMTSAGRIHCLRSSIRFSMLFSVLYRFIHRHKRTLPFLYFQKDTLKKWNINASQLETRSHSTFHEQNGLMWFTSEFQCRDNI